MQLYGIEPEFEVITNIWNVGTLVLFSTKTVFPLLIKCIDYI